MSLSHRWKTNILYVSQLIIYRLFKNIFYTCKHFTNISEVNKPLTAS